MKEINFVTMCDKNYFPYVNFSAKQLMKFYPNCKFFIYDWGFTQPQKNILKSYPITILVDWYEKIDWEFGYKKITEKFEGYIPPHDNLVQRKNEYLYSQVPVCILDCAKRINENLIVLDGDAFLINKIDEIFEDNFDIGVTLRPKDEIERARKMGIEAELNTAVIFFKLDSKRMQLFIEQWIRDIETSKKAWVDQTSLITLIKQRKRNILTDYYNKGIISISNIEFKIKTFPCNIYGLYQIEKGYNDKKVKILHIKSERRKENIRERIRGIRIYLTISKILKILPKLIRNRIIKIMDIKTLIIFIIRPQKLKKIEKITFKWLKFKKLLNFALKFF